jgi:hypothetical protein
MIDWDEVLKTLMVGTRNGGKIQFQNAALQQFSQQSSALSPERQLLNNITGYSFWLRAGTELGTLPDSAYSNADVSQAETLKPSTKTQIELGRQLIKLENTALIIAYLQALGRAKISLGNSLLPDLMELAKSNGKIAFYLVNCLSENAKQSGRLLASYQKVINYLPEDIWHHGIENQRKYFFIEQLKRDSVQAQEILASTWSTEKAADKLVFLKALVEYSPQIHADFLYPYLGNKSQLVNEQIAAILSQQHYPKYYELAYSMLLPILAIEKQSLRRDKLKLNLPEKFVRSWKKQGIAEKRPADLKMANSLYWLAQLVALVEPTWLAKEFGYELKTWLTMIKASDYQQELLYGLRLGALRTADLYFWALDVKTHFRQSSQFFKENFQRVPKKIVRQILPVFFINKHWKNDGWNQLLDYVTELPDSVARDLLANKLLPLLKNPHFSRSAGQKIALAIPVTLADEFNQFIQKLDTNSEDNTGLDMMIQTYQLRVKMQQEITS